MAGFSAGGKDVSGVLKKNYSWRVYVYRKMLNFGLQNENNCPFILQSSKNDYLTMVTVLEYTLRSVATRTR